MTHAQDHSATPASPATPVESVDETYGKHGKIEHAPVGKKIKRTRVSGTWIAVIVALVVLVFLLIFILQNLDTATVHFLGMEGSMPLAVAMLFSVIAGAALVALIGGARILQLRKQAKR